MGDTHEREEFLSVGGAGGEKLLEEAKRDGVEYLTSTQVRFLPPPWYFGVPPTRSALLSCRAVQCSAVQRSAPPLLLAIFCCCRLTCGVSLYLAAACPQVAELIRAERAALKKEVSELSHHFEHQLSAMKDGLKVCFFSPPPYSPC